MNESQPSVPRSVVLVHGLWSVPGDWKFVQQRLQEPGIEVLVPDLPSHRRPDAGLLDDVGEVRAAIRSVRHTPTVVVGWSYGCDVAGVAADGEEGVTRLVYVSSVPLPVQPDGRDGSTFDGSPIIVWDDQDRFVMADSNGCNTLNFGSCDDRAALTDKSPGNRSTRNGKGRVLRDVRS